MNLEGGLDSLFGQLALSSISEGISEKEGTDKYVIFSTHAHISKGEVELNVKVETDRLGVCFSHNWI